MSNSTPYDANNISLDSPPLVTSPTSLALAQDYERAHSGRNIGLDEPKSMETAGTNLNRMSSITRAFGRKSESSVQSDEAREPVKKEKPARKSLFRETVSFLARDSVPFVPDTRPIRCEGYLTKRGHVVTNWKTRYFVFRGNSVQYYQDEDAAHGNGKLLGQVEVDRVAPWTGESHGFMFFTSKRIPYYLYASSEEERNKWMNALKEYIVHTESVDCEGYLTKRGHLVPSYRQRYFVLRGSSLKYFNDHASYVAHESAIAEVEVTQVAKWDGEPTGIMFKTATGSRFYVYAESADDQKKWLNSLQKMVGSPDPVACAGYLTKQGHKRKSWKKRYFVLRGTMITYYGDYDSANSNGKPIAQVKVEDVQKWDGEPFGFMFMTTDQVPYYVFADNDRERRKWITALRKITTTTTEDTTKHCPKCSAALTGSRFCGACGYKIRATIGDPVDEMAQPYAAPEPVVATKEGGDDDNAFDDLEMLSEGARTLLLAVMKAPDSADPRASTRSLEKSSREDESEEKEPISDFIEMEVKKVTRVNLNDSPEKPPEINRFTGSPIKTTSEKSLDRNPYVELEANPYTDASPEKINIATKSEESASNDTPPPAPTQPDSNPVIVKLKHEEEVVSRDSDLSSDGQEGMLLDTRGIAGFDDTSSPITVSPSPGTPQPVSSNLHQYLEKELEFTPLYIPSAESPVRCRFYGSINYESASRIIIFISDSGPLAIWRQSQPGETGIQTDHPWAMTEYFVRALEDGYGIIVTNPFSNSAKVFEEGGRERVVTIPGSASPMDHIEFVWKNFAQKCTGTISIVAYGRGGALVKALIAEHESEIRKRLNRVAFLDSRHIVDGNETSGTLEILGRRAINWEASDISLGGQIVESQTRVGCVCLSCGPNIDGEDLSPTSIARMKESAFAFLRANPEKKGMTAVVGYIRQTIKKQKKRSSKSNVVVLGETDGSEASEESNDSATAQLRKLQLISDSRVSSTSSSRSSTPYIPQRQEPPSRGQISVNDFELTKVVGQGGFGKVFLARKITEPNGGRYFAMKVLKKKQVLASGLVNTTMAERHILTEIDHPFIVKLHYSFQSHTKLYLVMDYLSGGSLAYHLRRRRKFPENWAKFYSAEVAAAIAHLHSVNIIYRDAKLENVLMDHTGHVRITDFGLSKVGVSGLQGATTFCGTAAYIAPELLKGHAYGKAADWWSFGILLYEMIAGKPPYYHRNRDIMFQTILKQEWVTFSASFSDSAVSLIRGLLTRDPLKRLGSGPRGADEVLTHPFFNQIHWGDLLDKQLEPPFNPGVGEIDTHYAPRNVNVDDITPRDREMSLVAGKKGKNDFDGFSFIGKAPNL